MVTTDFEKDSFPGKLKILFVAEGMSSHTINWINLFGDDALNIRLFCLPHGMPPDDWPFRAYVTGLGFSLSVEESDRRKRRYSTQPLADPIPIRIIRRIKRELGIPYTLPDRSPEKWLIEIIDDWQPHIIHTLGMSAARYLSEALEQYDFKLQQQWFITIWGAPDTTLQMANPQELQIITNIFTHARWIMSDTQSCIAEARSIGVQDSQLPPHPILPVAGGVNVDEIQQWVKAPPSRRRSIIWPKVYNTYYMIGLTTLEAIKLCWDQIQPCELIIPSLRGDLAMWYHTLPDPIKEKTRIAEKTPHPELLKQMAQSRVMLAPSLLDGLPNVLVEAMAAGAFPIMSPLPMFADLLVDGENALLARNLYPNEIAQAIIRAMSDDELVDQAAELNLKRIRQIAHRPDVHQKAIENYRSAVTVQQNTT